MPERLNARQIDACTRASRTFEVFQEIWLHPENYSEEEVRGAIGYIERERANYQRMADKKLLSNIGSEIYRSVYAGLFHHKIVLPEPNKELSEDITPQVYRSIHLHPFYRFFHPPPTPNNCPLGGDSRLAP